MDINNIILCEQYKNIIPRPTTEEYSALKLSIQEEGIKLPLVVNSQNLLLDGYTRYQAAKELGLCDVPVEIKSFDSEEEEKTYIISVNLHRRHLNTAQKAELGLMLLEAEQEKAKKRMLAGKEVDPVQNFAQGVETGKAMELAAQKVGISRETLRQAQKIKEITGTDGEIATSWNRALNGKKGVHRVYNEMREKEMKEAITKIPPTLEPPSTGGRKTTAIRWVHPETGDVKYELCIGPNVTSGQLASWRTQKQEKEEYRQRWDAIEALQKEADDFRKEAQQLEACARELEKLVQEKKREMNLGIRHEIELEHGPIEPFVETYGIEVLDEELRVQLSKLGKAEADQIAKLLLTAWGTEKLEIRFCGIYGDINDGAADKACSIAKSVNVIGWTGIGGMDGLDNNILQALEMQPVFELKEVTS